MLARKLEEMKSSGSYRVFTPINRIANFFPKAIHAESGKEITIWCSNDYLGMGQSKVAINAAIKSINNFGVGAGGSRNIGGTNQIHNMLENEMASLHNKESSLIFPTGYSSNDVTLACLSRLIPECIFISDEKNHASIVNGLRQSAKTKKYIFKHNDLNDLEKILKNIDAALPKIIVFESIYSMDGDVAPIVEIVELAKKYNALTYLDEVHAIGMYGVEGSGYANKLGVSDKIDIIQGTFAKAYGVIGGYIAGSNVFIDAIRSFGNGFIFTTYLAPATVATILHNVQYLRCSDKERNDLLDKTNELRIMMKNNNIPLMPASTTHILPVLIGDSDVATKVSRYLLEQHNIYIQAINSPTVSIGTERLRINASPYHSTDDMKALIKALKDTLQHYNLY
jgi:5-aminolevulinate synthase